MNNIIFKTLLLKGEAGNDIQSVEKTATSGLVDTYTITLTDGSTHTFNVTNGNSIVSIEKTSSVGYVDTYTITYNDGSTDTFEITLATVTVDNALSDSSTNPVQNKLITQNLNHLTNNTCVNLLNPTAQTQTVNGVTFTNNGDGTYTVNGTASADAVFNYASITDFTAFENTKLVGCPAGGSYTTSFMAFDCFDGGTSTKRYSDTGNGILVSDIPSQTNVIRLRIAVKSGYTANNLLFKPMLTIDLNATYDDYVPYTGDSGRLNEEVARLIPVQEQIVPSANIESGTTASQAYTVGAYLVFNGKLCKVISAIARGDTLTVGTNIEATTSGGELTRLNSDLINSFDSGLSAITPSGSSGAIVAKAISFHHAFSQIPSVICTLITNSADYFGALTVRDVTVNGFTVYLHTLKPISNPPSLNVNWIAIVHPE